MKKFTSLMFAAGASLLIGSTSQAAVLLTDNFDSYANQAAFEAAWTPIGTVVPISGVLSTAQALSPTQSIQAPGTATTGQNRNRRSFSESGTVGFGVSIVWSFAFWDAGTTTAATPARNYSNLQDSTAPSATNQLISMGLNNNQTAANSGGNFLMARILGYDATTGADPNGGPAQSVAGSGAYFKLNDYTGALRTAAAGWRVMKVVISSDNGLSTDYDFFVDNVLVEEVDNVGTAASIRSYDNIVVGSGNSNASVQAFYDNEFIETVPEPTSLAVFGLAGLAFLSRRRAN